MTLKSFIPISVVSLTLLSLSVCSAEKDKTVIHFTRADFRDSVQVKLDTIPISKGILNPVSMYVTRDSLLLVRNAQNSDYMVEIYNLNTQQFLVKAGKSGRGPNEVLGGFVLYKSDQDYFLLFDLVARRFQKYDIDSLLKYKFLYQPLIQNVPIESVDIALIDSNRFVYYDDRYLESKKFSNEVPELGIELINSHISYDAKDFKYFAGSINGGNIYVKPDNSKIAVFSICDDRIHIYNNNLILLKTLNGPDDYVLEYVTTRTSWGITTMQCKNRISAYGVGFATNDHIYIVYNGDNSFKPYTEVFKLSWDGELIKRYIVKFKIIVLTVSDGYIYATGFRSPRGMAYLVKFKI